MADENDPFVKADPKDLPKIRPLESYDESTKQQQEVPKTETPKTEAGPRPDAEQPKETAQTAARTDDTSQPKEQSGAQAGQQKGSTEEQQKLTQGQINGLDPANKTPVKTPQVTQEQATHVVQQPAQQGHAQQGLTPEQIAALNPVNRSLAEAPQVTPEQASHVAEQGQERPETRVETSPDRDTPQDNDTDRSLVPYLGNDELSRFLAEVHPRDMDQFFERVKDNDPRATSEYWREFAEWQKRRGQPGPEAPGLGGGKLDEGYIDADYRILDDRDDQGLITVDNAKSNQQNPPGPTGIQGSSGGQQQQQQGQQNPPGEDTSGDQQQNPPQTYQQYLAQNRDRLKYWMGTTGDLAVAGLGVVGNMAEGFGRGFGAAAKLAGAALGGQPLSMASEAAATMQAELGAVREMIVQSSQDLSQIHLPSYYEGRDKALMAEKYINDTYADALNRVSSAVGKDPSNLDARDLNEVHRAMMRVLKPEWDIIKQKIAAGEKLTQEDQAYKIAYEAVEASMQNRVSNLWQTNQKIQGQLSNYRQFQQALQQALAQYQQMQQAGGSGGAGGAAQAPAGGTPAGQAQQTAQGQTKAAGAAGAPPAANGSAVNSGNINVGGNKQQNNFENIGNSNINVNPQFNNSNKASAYNIIINGGSGWTPDMILQLRRILDDDNVNVTSVSDDGIDLEINGKKAHIDKDQEGSAEQSAEDESVPDDIADATEAVEPAVTGSTDVDEKMKDKFGEGLNDDTDGSGAAAPPVPPGPPSGGDAGAGAAEAQRESIADFKDVQSVDDPNKEKANAESYVIPGVNKDFKRVVQSTRDGASDISVSPDLSQYIFMDRRGNTIPLPRGADVNPPKGFKGKNFVYSKDGVLYGELLHNLKHNNGLSEIVKINMNGLIADEDYVKNNLPYVRTHTAFFDPALIEKYVPLPSHEDLKDFHLVGVIPQNAISDIPEQWKNNWNKDVNYAYGLPNVQDNTQIDHYGKFRMNGHTYKVGVNLQGLITDVNFLKKMGPDWAFEHRAVAYPNGRSGHWEQKGVVDLYTAKNLWPNYKDWSGTTWTDAMNEYQQIAGRPYPEVKQGAYAGRGANTSAIPKTGAQQPPQPEYWKGSQPEEGVEYYELDGKNYPWKVGFSDFSKPTDYKSPPYKMYDDILAQVRLDPNNIELVNKAKLMAMDLGIWGSAAGISKERTAQTKKLEEFRESLVQNPSLYAKIDMSQLEKVQKAYEMAEKLAEMIGDNTENQTKIDETPAKPTVEPVIQTNNAENPGKNEVVADTSVKNDVNPPVKEQKKTGYTEEEIRDAQDASLKLLSPDELKKAYNDAKKNKATKANGAVSVTALCSAAGIDVPPKGSLEYQILHNRLKAHKLSLNTAEKNKIDAKTAQKKPDTPEIDPKSIKGLSPNVARLSPELIYAAKDASDVKEWLDQVVKADPPFQFLVNDPSHMRGFEKDFKLIKDAYGASGQQEVSEPPESPEVPPAAQEGALRIQKPVGRDEYGHDIDKNGDVIGSDRYKIEMWMAKNERDRYPPEKYGEWEAFKEGLDNKDPSLTPDVIAKASKKFKRWSEKMIANIQSILDRGYVDQAAMTPEEYENVVDALKINQEKWQRVHDLMETIDKEPQDSNYESLFKKYAKPGELEEYKNPKYRVDGVHTIYDMLVDPGTTERALINAISGIYRKNAAKKNRVLQLYKQMHGQ